MREHDSPCCSVQTGGTHSWSALVPSEFGRLQSIHVTTNTDKMVQQQNPALQNSRARGAAVPISEGLGVKKGGAGVPSCAVHAVLYTSWHDQQHQPILVARVYFKRKKLGEHDEGMLSTLQPQPSNGINNQKRVCNCSDCWKPA